MNPESGQCSTSVTRDVIDPSHVDEVAPPGGADVSITCHVAAVTSFCRNAVDSYAINTTIIKGKAVVGADASLHIPLSDGHVAELAGPCSLQCSHREAAERGPGADGRAPHADNARPVHVA